MLREKTRATSRDVAVSALEILKTITQVGQAARIPKRIVRGLEEHGNLNPKRRRDFDG
jgi:hypothetical protein